MIFIGAMLTLILLVSIRFVLKYKQADKKDQAQLNAVYLPFLGALKLIAALGSTSLLIDLYITEGNIKCFSLVALVTLQLATSTYFLASQKSSAALTVGLILAFIVALLGCFCYSKQFQPLSLPLMLFTVIVDWLLGVLCILLLNKTERLA